MTDLESLKVKKILEGAFPQWKQTPESDLVFAIALKDYDFKIMFDIAIVVVKTVKFFPTIADLISRYNEFIEVQKDKENNFLILWVGKMEEANVIDYAEAVMLTDAICEKTLTELQKQKIIEFSKNDQRVIRLLRGENYNVNQIT